MTDTVSPKKRSEIMKAVRSAGNSSTELAVETVLRHDLVRGWIKHPPNIPGHPDFYFRKAKLALFVDGCFWHACPKCARRTPKRNREFWEKKIESNRQRDIQIRRKLNRSGYLTMRIWEHELKSDIWLSRLLRRLGS